MKANNGQANPVAASWVEDNLLNLLNRPQRYHTKPEVAGKERELGPQRRLDAPAFTMLINSCNFGWNLDRSVFVWVGEKLRCGWGDVIFHEAGVSAMRNSEKDGPDHFVMQQESNPICFVTSAIGP